MHSDRIFGRSDRIRSDPLATGEWIVAGLGKSWQVIDDD